MKSIDRYDPLDLEAQEKARQKRELEQASTDRMDAEDIKWLMSDKRGRRIMWRLLEKTGVYRTSMTGDNYTFFNEGARNIGLDYILSVNANAPGQYDKMVTEQINDRPK